MILYCLKEDNMIKINKILSIIIILNSLYCFSSDRIFKIFINEIDRNYIAGAPIIVKVKIKNISGAIQEEPPKEGVWLLKGKYCPSYEIDSEVVPLLKEDKMNEVHIKVNANWEKEIYYDLSRICLLNKAGLYELEYKLISSVYKYEIAEAAKINIEISYPKGIDEEAYEEFKGFPLAYPEKILEKYPTSIYAGWALFTYQPDLPGPVVKNESAKKALLAIINGNSLEIKKWWKIDIKNISNEREQKIAQNMKMLMSNLELFANAHPDFMFSGYLLARSGFNALVLSEYKRACFMLDKSLKMPWGLAEFDKQRLKVHRDGTEWALGFLKENGLFK